MNVRFALLVAGLPLLALGGEGIYQAARNRRQLPMTCEEFVRNRPSQRWLRLTGCALDYTSPGYRESNGRIVEIFFPVRAAGQPAGTPAPLLAATSDPQALAIVQGTIGNGRQPDQESLTVMMLRVVTQLRAAREIEGVARTGAIALLQTRRSLQAFPVPLDPQYVVVDLHARPSVAVPATEAGVGLLAVLLFVLSGRNRRSQVAEQPAADLPAQPLPAMLLLNLDGSAGIDAIEGAPPLGTREQVEQAIGRALPGIHFDPQGRSTFQRPDARIDIELGEQEPVWTATVRGSGDGATSTIEALAARTGWRIYVPRRGAFLNSGAQSQEHDEQRA